MANATVTKELIEVHGRGSLVLPIRVFDDQGVQIDLSARTLRFEVDGVLGAPGFSELLVANPSDPKGKLLKLERAQIATLSKQGKQFALIDETNAAQDIYTVVWSGLIKRVGYVTVDQTDEL